MIRNMMFKVFFEILRFSSDYSTILGDDCTDRFERSHLFKPVKSHPTTSSTRVVAINSTLLSKYRNFCQNTNFLLSAIACIVFGAIGVTEEQHKFNKIAWFFWSLSAFTILAVCVSISRQPQSAAPLDFKVLF